MWLKDKGFTRRLGTFAMAGLLALGLAACEGEDGSAGGGGSAGPSGPSGPGGGSGQGVVNASQADVIFPTVTGVTVGTQTVVSFRLSDSENRGVTGLQAGNLRLALAKLVPGTGGGSSYWQSYINVNRAPAAGFDGTVAENQATTETATAARLVDNGNGSYRYTFSFDINKVTTPVAVPYEPNRTHRVSLQIDGPVPVDNNASYTWQPSTNAASGAFSREIVDNDTCNACHDGLAFHGGRRNDTQYCVTCHNPGSVDPESTNTVNMSTMIHNIHAGARGGVVLDGGRYYIVGYRNTVYDYSEIQFTQDVRNCQTCHQESDADTPDASNWREVVNAEACGSCHHSNVNFATGENHGAGAATDDQCTACHGANSTYGGGAYRAEVAHLIPTVEAGKRFKFNVLSVSNTAPGEFPQVRFSVTDPTSSDAPYDIHTAAPFTVCAGGASRLFVDIAWSTTDYTNPGTGFNPGQPVQINVLNACGGNSVKNGDGSFTATSPVAVPAGQTGSLLAALEGHPAVDADPDVAGIERIAVTNAVKYAAITDASPKPRRTVVEIARCDECHKQLSLHGSNRTDSIDTCVACHAPGATDIARRVAGSNCETVTGTLDDQTIDMKVMIHAIHAGPVADYQVCGFGNTGYDFSHVTYVGKLNNCEGCHKPDRYYPVDSTVVVGTTTDANNPATFTDDVATSPNSAACGACHVSGAARAHMQGNGGDFAAGKDASGRMVSSGLETCVICHGAGKPQDVKVMHDVGAFEVYNVRDND
jgi:OmcA/MtrC family decaheme c-type cytochrome